jgi:hypothetical protein
MNLENRVSKLEQKVAPTGKTYTVWAADDETNEQAIARAGIDAKPEDMVICISFVDP